MKRFVFSILLSLQLFSPLQACSGKEQKVNLAGPQGREYLLTTQQLDIFGTAATYKGPVLLLHGDKDNIVPLWCSKKYLETYGERATLHVIPGVNHTITTRRNEVLRYVVDFFRQLGSSMK